LASSFPQLDIERLQEVGIVKRIGGKRKSEDAPQSLDVTLCAFVLITG
jgi:hypothetical protein